MPKAVNRRKGVAVEVHRGGKAEAPGRFQAGSEFGAENRRWDRTWTVVAFTIPESAREVRELPRSRLKWLGFAPLYGALWVSAWDTADELESSCRAFGVDNYIIFRTAESDLRGKPLIQAWDLDELQKQNTPFIETYGPRAAESHSGIGLRDAFRLRTEAMDAWRAFPWNDPGLPSELLPETFPLFEVRQAFVRLYDSLADAALEHTQEAVRAIAPELGEAAKATRIGQG